MKPNATRHNPDPAYIKSLIKASGLSFYKLADRLGLSRAVLYKWVSGQSQIPYVAQFALERLKRPSVERGRSFDQSQE